MKIRNAFIKLISFTMIFIMFFSLIPAGTMTIHAEDEEFIEDPDADRIFIVVDNSGWKDSDYGEDDVRSGSLYCSKHGHTYDSGVVVAEPTYRWTGLKRYKCEICGAERHEDIPKLECNPHAWDSGTVTTRPTYQSEGVRTYICVNCRERKTEPIPKLVCNPHSWDAGKITTKATYKNDGVKTYTCKNCGQTKTETIPKLVCNPHAWDEGKITTKATYKNDGVKTYTCKNCGQTKAETIPKLVCSAHSWDEGKITTKATYKSAGVKTYTCTNCGQTKTEAIPKLVCKTHAWDDGKITTKATYKNDGVKTLTCKNCGQTKTETIPQFVCTAHVYGNSILTPANNGVYYYVSECTRCGETHSERHEHNYKWVTIKPATESETGIERYLCEECGYYIYEREIATGKVVVSCKHPYPRNFVETVPATCCTYPRGQVVCKECGEIVISDYEYAKLGYNSSNHSHFTEKVTVEPTYKKTAVKKYTCDGCGYSYTETIPKLVCLHDGRTYIQDYNKEAWVVCKLCGEKLEKTNYKGPSCSHIGTKKTQVLVKAPTATEWGEAAMVCSCGKKVTTEKLHPYSEYQVTKSDGSTVTVYGWFDYDAAHEIADQTNAYRLENGLNALNYNESLQSGSDTRALETIASFSHTRPDGSRWNTTMSEWTYGGENLAGGQTSVESAMNAWKESPSHNANLLYGIESGQTPFKGISVGVFHRYIFNYANKPYTPSEYIYWTQNYTFY